MIVTQLLKECLSTLNLLFQFSHETCGVVKLFKINLDFTKLCDFKTSKL